MGRHMTHGSVTQYGTRLSRLSRPVLATGAGAEAAGSFFTTAAGSFLTTVAEEAEDGAGGAEAEEAEDGAGGAARARCRYESKA